MLKQVHSHLKKEKTLFSLYSLFSQDKEMSPLSTRPVIYKTDSAVAPQCEASTDTRTADRDKTGYSA